MEDQEVLESQGDEWSCPSSEMRIQGICSLLSEVLIGLTLAEGMEVAAAAKLHEQARELVGFKMGVKRGKKRMVQQAQNVSLSLSSGQFLPPSKHALIHDLHGEQASSHSSKLGQIHAPDVPKPQLLEQPEMPQPQFSVSVLHALNRLPPNVAPLVWLGRA
ncbi:hypothetical protein G2W53_025114 [Senna tora]|uniref:Uncharacterized protein n=1 Tax=Senna tora TaxID=362788 RepID=A0A834TLL7_9FABA|nr:hypothetical protein G2W53_025114 [Senna tora]